MVLNKPLIDPEYYWKKWQTLLWKKNISYQWAFYEVEIKKEHHKERSEKFLKQKSLMNHYLKWIQLFNKNAFKENNW